MRTLDELPVGHSAQVAAILGDDQVALRLLEMGIVEGEPVELIGRAPWGDPLDVRVRGYRVSIRRTEAQRVQLADG